MADRTREPTFADLFTDALEASDFAGYGGQERFRRYLAERYAVEVSDSTVSAWKRGERTPGVSNLVAIMDALVISVDERAAWLSAAGAGPSRSVA